MAQMDLLADEELKQCVDFHGHLCPGLALGVVASREAMARLEAARARDEEIVAIVETDACCVDAVQVITGSTFGKGNFFFRDHGKVAMTFMSRASEKAWRFLLKEDALNLSDRHRELMKKNGDKTATPAEKEAFWQLHEQVAREVLQTPCGDLFGVSEITPQIPPKAKVEPSRLCDRCREPVMASRLIGVGGEALCPACMAL